MKRFLDAGLLLLLILEGLLALYGMRQAYLEVRARWEEAPGEKCAAYEGKTLCYKPREATK